ncbi:MAG: cyclase family protein [Caldilineaceae bacterium SB0665_bin_25]|nr:cyclase family protein [Caldilineaceae bacterium SB0665_bin_25]
MQRKIVDLSYPLAPSTPPFPGDSPVEIEMRTSIPAHLPPGTPGHMNTSNLRTSLHTGTHMDAFFHFYHDGTTIDQIPLAQCIGPALLLDLSTEQAKEEITAYDLTPHRQAISRASKLILNTGWAQNWGKARYFTDYPPLTEDAARFLVDCAVELVGIDTPSVDYSPNDAHFVLLGNDVLIVENLTNLDQIGQPLFEFAALPLKITGRDGSPVRAVAIIDEA